MVHPQFFYKLLDIPETAGEPTLYQLLGISPRAFDPALVGRALSERKKRLRQNIPGPQFIPVVATIERELDGAAEVLRDAARRKAYDAHLAREKHDAALQEAKAQRTQLTAAVHETISSHVDAAGSLSEHDRPTLAKKLRHIGVDDRNVQVILAEIPKPPAPPPPEQVTAVGVPRETLDFFATATDLSISQGVLAVDDERRLLALAEKLAIPAPAALNAINTRLSAKGARRGQLDLPALTALFQHQLEKLYPDRQAPPAERIRLVGLGVAQGLSVEAASQAVQNHFEPSAGPQATPLEIIETLPEDEELLTVQPVDDGPLTVEPLSEPPLTPRAAPTPAQRGWSPAHTPPPAEPAFGVREARATAPLRLTPSTPAGRLEPVPAVPRTPPAGQAAVTATLPAPLHDAGVTQAPAARRSDFARALTIIIPLAVIAIFSVVALIYSLSQRESNPPQKEKGPLPPSTKTVVTPPPPSTKTTVPPPPPATKTPVRPPPPATKTTVPSPGVPPLASQLLSAAGSSDRLADLVGAAAPDEFQAALAYLAASAADRTSLTAAAASRTLDALSRSDVTSRVPDQARIEARLALCQVIRTTSDPTVAGTARASLNRAVRWSGGGSSPTVLFAKLDTPTARQQAAAAWEAAVRRDGTTPPPDPATGRPRVAVPSDDIRRAYSTTNRVEDLLADTAMTLLAWWDRAAQFAQGSNHCSPELSRLLSAGADRPAAVAERVTLPPAPAAPAPAPPPATGAPAPVSLDEFKAKLQGRSTGECYWAIERLRQADTAAAADILVAELARRARDASAPVAEAPSTSRILRALGQMNVPEIPKKLAGVLRDSRNNDIVAYLVAKCMHTTLREQLGTYFSGLRYPESDLVLRRSFSREELQKCVEGWDEAVENLERRASLFESMPRGRTRPGWIPRAPAGLPTPRPMPMRPAPGPRPAPAAEPPAWQPDPTRLKLLAAAANYASQAAESLKDYKWGGRAPGPVGNPAVANYSAPADLAGEVAGALDRLVAQLTRLAREHASHGAHRPTLERIEAEAKARALASESTVPQAAVRLDAAAAILEVLIQECGPSDAVKASVAKARQDRAAAVTATAVQELRESAIHGLVLWDLLLSAGSRP
ncbi:MAG: hypothetical protein FJ290_03685 [Planctomycetes bacterium]|nr:hypothetical protein [Planctomycetota bacterium]